MEMWYVGKFFGPECYYSALSRFCIAAGRSLLLHSAIPCLFDLLHYAINQPNGVHPESLWKLGHLCLRIAAVERFTARRTADLALAAIAVNLLPCMEARKLSHAGGKQGCLVGSQSGS